MLFSRKIAMLSNFFYKISFWTAAVLIGLIFFLMLLQVFYRYVLNQPLSWPEEAALVFFPWVVFLGASMALKDRVHVGINFIVDRFPMRFRNVTRIFIGVLVVFFAGYLSIYGWKLSVFVGSGQTTIFWRIPYFFLYLSTCVGGGLLTIQGILLLIQDLLNCYRPVDQCESGGLPATGCALREE